MRSRLLTAGVVLVVLLGAGLAGSRVGLGAWERLQGDMPVLTAEDIEAAAGEGIMVGLLGGFRAVTADFLWVRTNAVWEDRDLPATQTLIKLVTTVDARPLVFWVNGARMIAYDMPVWRVDDAGGDVVVPRVVQARIHQEQGRAGIAVLERARTHHPDEPLLLIEIGNILQRKLGDLAGCAELYRRAARMPGAPYYAARIHAEMLKQLGREAEALAWLREVHATLPANDVFAMPEVVLGRIRELEERLGVPEDQRYVPPAGKTGPGGAGVPE